MKSINQYFAQLKSIFTKKRYQKQVKAEKQKLYIHKNEEKKFQSQRKRQKFFTTRLEFDDTFEKMKKFNVYYFIIGGVLIVMSFYVLLFSHYFSLKNIEILREDDGINIDLGYRSIEKFRYRPILFIDKNLISQSIVSHQPNIQDVYIRKILPDTLKIILKSYKEIFSFQYENKFYNISSNGVIIPGKETSLLPHITIIGYNTLGISDYKKVFSAEKLQKIQHIEELISAESSFIVPKKILYYLKENEVHIITDDHIRIIFDLTKSEEVQVKKLTSFYKNYKKDIAYGMVYIDLRINERILYCSTQEEYQCKKNLESIYDIQKEP